MDLIRYIFLGIIQGFTEPIPVSSSGHLIIFREILQLEFLYDLNFEIIVNFGSFVAIAYFYRKDIMEIFNDFFLYIKTKKKDYKDNFNYGLLIIIATIPTAIAGFLFKNSIESISNPKTVGVALLMTAGLLYIIRKSKGKKSEKKITIKDALIIGLYQVLSLIPGVSRSGATIVGGMFRDLKRDTAFKFSFMLYLPVSIAAMILGVHDFLKTPEIEHLILPYIFGMIVAGIVTYYSLIWFRNIVLKGKLIYFVYYCLGVGLISLLFL